MKRILMTFTKKTLNKANDTVAGSINEVKSTMLTTFKWYAVLGFGIGLTILVLLGSVIYKILS